MRVLIGFMYRRGLYGLNHLKIDILFNDKTSPPIFGAIFSRNRVKFLLASISFISRDECIKNFLEDRFASCRPMFELFNANCSKYLVPTLYMTIDETLYSMHHQIAFRQYNPNKPYNYRLLYKSLNGASFPFTYKTTPYAGKPTNGDGPYYIDCNENYAKYLVNTTENDISLRISLGNWLLEWNITTVGTVNTTRIGIPDELKTATDRDECSATCHFESKEKTVCLITYILKTKSKGKENVLLLSTVRPVKKKTKDDKKDKPAIYKLYDFTKGATDIMDQMNDFYTTHAKTCRWSVLAFYYMLDTIQVNAKWLWCIKHKKSFSKISTFDIAFELANALVMPFFEQRNLNGLGKPLLKKINYVLDKEEHVRRASKERKFPRSGNHQRCRIYLNGCKTKAEKDRLKKQQQRCESCGESTCNIHSICVCDDCNKA